MQRHESLWHSISGPGSVETINNNHRLGSCARTTFLTVDSTVLPRGHQIIQMPSHGRKQHGRVNSGQHHPVLGMSCMPIPVHPPPTPSAGYPLCCGHLPAPSISKNSHFSSFFPAVSTRRPLLTWIFWYLVTRREKSGTQLFTSRASGPEGGTINVLRTSHTAAAKEWLCRPSLITSLK